MFLRTQSNSPKRRKQQKSVNKKNTNKDMVDNKVLQLPESPKNGAVLIETRCLPGIIDVIKNHIYFLGPDWGLTIFHGTDNEGYLRDLLKGWVNVKLVNINAAHINEANYNNMLTSSWFWESLPYEKVLIFQHDSLLRKRGIEEFLKYDYIGAPWPFQEHGGNGGLSLRTKQVMLDITKALKYNMSVHGNEDIYFCNYMNSNNMTGLAPRSECLRFSVETIFYPDPIGIHAADKYLPKEQVDKLTSTIVYDAAN
jgi:hypothetical protein